ncbi:hypothetical protein FACS18942_08760 [Planctomycetales bacterium]|nr:hypothetical protein FACS18942_08760 [Planctomycetales bacterium]
MIQKLIDAGYARPGQYLDYYDECDCGPGGKIRWKVSSKTGKQQAFCRCKLGTCPVKTEEFQTWDIIVPAVIQSIGTVLGFTPPFKEVLPSVWSLGRKMRRVTC